MTLREACVTVVLHPISGELPGCRRVSLGSNIDGISGFRRGRVADPFSSPLADFTKELGLFEKAFQCLHALARLVPGRVLDGLDESLDDEQGHH